MLHNITSKPAGSVPSLNGHPWIFSGAIERIEGDDRIVGVADVFDSKKNWLARGLYNPKSQIRVRLLTWQKEEIDSEFFTRRLSPALGFRKRHLAAATNAYRIINGEGRFFTGIDRRSLRRFPRLSIFHRRHGAVQGRHRRSTAVLSNPAPRSSSAAKAGSETKKASNPRSEYCAASRRRRPLPSRKMAINFSSMFAAGRKPAFFWTSAITARFYRPWRAIAVY